MAAVMAPLATLAPAGPLAAGTQHPSPTLPDTFVERVRALALIETLNAAILASRSATTTLQAWCRDHAMAEPAIVTARLLAGNAKEATAEQRARLQVGPSEPVRYRHVQLVCGGHVLSDAENWYVPGRLTAAMNTMLEETDTPFGRAVSALRPTRQTFAVDLLWSPLPAHWEMQPPKADLPGASSEVPSIALPSGLFEHRAILSDAFARPFSEVDERYTSALLEFRRNR